MSSNTRTAPADDLRARLFAGLGEMRGRFRTFDWKHSPLGPVEAWPLSLRTAASMILASGFANIVLWGPELIQLYNDGYREVMGAKHPSGFGAPTREVWPEAWAFNAPIYDRVRNGETVYLEDQLIPLERYGRLEDVWFTLSYSPILGDAADVAGVLVTLLETTDRVRARALEAERERLLQQVEVERNRLGEVFQQAPAFLAVLRGEQHVFELANDSYRQLVGEREIMGQPVDEALPEVREQGFVTLLDRVLVTGEPFHGREVPVMLARTPGAPPEQRYVDFVYQALTEADGTRSGIVAHGTDVTEQVNARHEVERLLGESERRGAELAAARAEVEMGARRLQDVFEQAPMAVAVLTGRDHVYTVVSPAYARYLGDRPLVGRAFLDAVPEPGGVKVAAYMDEAYTTGRPVVLREQVVPLDRDGDGAMEEYLFDISYQPLRDADGNVYAITSLSLDVTEQVRARRLAEQAAATIARAGKQLERVLSQAPVAIAVLEGPEHCFTLANPAYQALVHRTDLVGKTLGEAFPQGTSLPILDRVFATDTPFVASEFAAMLDRGDGERRDAWFNLVFQPLHDDTGKVYAIVVVAVDVSAHVRARTDVERLLEQTEEQRRALSYANEQLEEQQAELEMTNQQLQENTIELEAQADELQVQAEELLEQTRLAESANRAKSDFLTTMSHELRTPLNAIGGYADLLLAGVRGELTQPQSDDIERMKRSGQHLLGLINDILNFARLDAGQVEFVVRPVTVASVLDGVHDLVAPQMAARSLRFGMSGCGDDVTVHADPDKVRQILLNLVTNAVKFTPANGEITLRCEVDAAQVRVHVRDTGRGIEPERLAQVFDPFVQVDRHLTPASQQGIGLGLAISRELALGMGGQLSAVSTPGEGSTFTLALRRADGSSEAAGNEAAGAAPA